MLILFLGCGYTPVPPHPDGVEPLSEAALALDFDGTRAAVAPFLVDPGGLSPADSRSWSETRAAAEGVVAATRKSELARAYGDLVGSCMLCHADTPAPPLSGEGHAAAFRHLELSVIHDDDALAESAHDGIRVSPDLGPSHPRFLQLARRIRTGRGSRGAEIGKLRLECYQCHATGGRAP